LHWLHWVLSRSLTWIPQNIVRYMGYVANKEWVLYRMNRFIGSLTIVTTLNCRYFEIAISIKSSTLADETQWRISPESAYESPLYRLDTAILHGGMWRYNLSAWSWRMSTVRSRCQGTADEDTADCKKI
jgi:hypothetical protein